MDGFHKFLLSRNRGALGSLEIYIFKSIVLITQLSILHLLSITLHVVGPVFEGVFVFLFLRKNAALLTVEAQVYFRNDLPVSWHLHLSLPVLCHLWHFVVVVFVESLASLATYHYIGVQVLKFLLEEPLHLTLSDEVEGSQSGSVVVEVVVVESSGSGNKRETGVALFRNLVESVLV